MIVDTTFESGDVIETVTDDRGETIIATITLVNYQGNPNAQVTLERDPVYDFVDITCTPINPSWFPTYIAREPVRMDDITPEQFQIVAHKVLASASVDVRPRDEI